MCPRVLFEPIGEEIDCDEEESVLDASFRQGYNLVYGCREGQCSACRPTCWRARWRSSRIRPSRCPTRRRRRATRFSAGRCPTRDLVVELLHFDPDNWLENPIREGLGTVVALEELTRDIRRLLLRVDEPADFSFVPGQYVDVWIPGSDARRSFSMANMPGDGRIELIIKRYPGGRFSSLLDGALSIGDELRFTGPYGALHLRAGDGPVLMVAGGSGMAPVLSLLRQLAAQRSERECASSTARAAPATSSTWI